MSVPPTGGANDMKKALMVLLLACQFGGVVGVATASAPWPDCGPCKVGR